MVPVGWGFHGQLQGHKLCPVKAMILAPFSLFTFQGARSPDPEHYLREARWLPPGQFNYMWRAEMYGAVLE